MSRHIDRHRRPKSHLPHDDHGRSNSYRYLDSYRPVYEGRHRSPYDDPRGPISQSSAGGNEDRYFASSHHNDMPRGRAERPRRRTMAPIRHYDHDIVDMYSDTTSSPIQCTARRNSRHHQTEIQPQIHASGSSSDIMQHPVLHALPSDYKECIEIFRASPNRRVEHMPDTDHISPNEAMFHSPFDTVEKSALDLERKWRGCIAEPRSGIQLTSSLHDALDRSHSPWMNGSARVAFIGDCGEGKSSLIGAILGDGKVIEQGNDGESVTQVVFEYHYFLDQYFEYSISIRLFSLTEIVEKIELSLQNLIHGLFPCDGAEDEYFANRKLAAAKKVFTALFPETAFLKEATSSDSQKMIL
ncbi:hypothetical protein BKA63DRAFT_83672 [Paraphoma chrysanthemicola]|nr:hypothetical protein BKA63DRAFT_83672 [Paraphoma chrysanthemicola]